MDFPKDTILTPRLGWMIAIEQGRKPSQICKDFSISRKTLYKWKRRYIDGNKESTALLDRSRRPHNFPRITEKSVIDLIYKIADEHGYGQRRIRKHLKAHFGIDLSERTIWKYLKKRVEVVG